MNDIQRIIESVPAAIAEEGDYEDGGLLYCGKCHTPKQFMAPFPWGEQIVKISCACEKEASEKLEALKKEYERRDRINDLRKDGLPFSLRESTFDKDDGTNTEIMNLAKQYAEKWEKMVKKKEGLLFWGGTGSGNDRTKHKTDPERGSHQSQSLGTRLFGSGIRDNRLGGGNVGTGKSIDEACQEEHP